MANDEAQNNLSLQICDTKCQTSPCSYGLQSRGKKHMVRGYKNKNIQLNTNAELFRAASAHEDRGAGTLRSM